jgi:hypothetical protein
MPEYNTNPISMTSEWFRRKRQAGKKNGRRSEDGTCRFTKEPA